VSPRIKRIDHIRGFGSFNDWERDDELPDFKRYNLIYGWNGSGKTTLVRLIRMFETRRVHGVADRESLDIRITLSDDSSLLHSDVDTSTTSFRVFNEDFVSDNLEFDTATASPLLILGEDNVEAAKELEELRDMQAVIQAEHDSVEAEHSRVEDRREQFLADTARSIKTSLRNGPDPRFNDYNKGDVRSYLDGIPEEADRPSIDREDEEGRLRSLPLQPLAIESPPDVGQLPSLWSEMEGLLAKELVGAIIEELRSDADVQKWVERGLRLHEEWVERCLFCNQDLPSARIDALLEHFSSEFKSHVTKVGSLIERLEELKSSTRSYRDSIASITDSALYPDLRDSWSQARRRLERAFGLVERLLDCALDELAAKKADPWEKIDSPVALARAERMTERAGIAIAAMTEAVACNADRRTNLDSVRRDAQRQLEIDMVWDARPRYMEFISESQDLLEAIVDLRACLEEISAAVRRLEAAAADDAPALEGLNAAFESFFGHGVLTVAPATDTGGEGGMRLMRNGRIATHLSAGERNGIALVYFLLWLRDARTDLENTVVVIDDPVSSLDAGALYQAFSFIYEHTAAAAQLIVLTHDFRLFRLVRNRFGQVGYYKDTSDTEMFMTVKRGLDPESSSKLICIEPTLRNFDSEYHYLYVCVRRFAAGEVDGVPGAQEMPNVVRRLLESFLAFKLPSKSGIGVKLNELVGDTAEVQRILRFVHDYSHAGGLASFERIGAVDNEEALQVARDVMTLMNALDTDHVSVMRNNQ